MKVIFMGTPDFSVGTFESIMQAGHEIVLAVTQPDKPRGRGKEMSFSPIKEAAIAHGIQVFQPVKIRDAKSVETLASYEADVMVVVAFGQIIPREILEMTTYGCINVHASLLPKYRGAAPIQWSIIKGEEVTGVTTMQMDEGLDTGEMLLKAEIPISQQETGGSLHDKLASLGADLLVKTLEKIESKQIIKTPQGESPTPYAAMLKKEMGFVDFNEPAVEIEKEIRAFNPWPGSFTYWGNKVMKLWSATVKRSEGNEKQVGTVLKVTKESFFVQTKEGIIEINSVQLPGKKRMDTTEFLRGNSLQEGTILGNKN